MGSAERAVTVKVAISDLRKAIELYEKQKDSRAGDEKFKEAFSKAYNDLAWAYEVAMDYIAAVPFYDKSFEINPAYLYAITGKGDALRKAGKLDAALAAYESVLKHPEANQESQLAAYRGEGLVFWERKNLERVVSLFTEAEKIEHSEEIGQKLEEAKNALKKSSPKRAVR